MAEPLVGVVMGSASDWEAMQHCAAQLEALGVPFETRVLSAHRTPRELSAWIEDAESRGAEVFIAAAGMAAALPGVVAAQTTRPVLGVPMETKISGGLDSLLSMVQMPGGIPVGVLAVGKAGAVNAAILATQILGRSRPELDEAVGKHREAKAAEILTNPDPSVSWRTRGVRGASGGS
jgi:5-(carboxyamino)imidazole ribonucleotide mutase